MELYRKYRPTSFEQVKGQRAAVGVIRGWIKKNAIPHVIMLEGPSGVGKTTLARIIATHLGASVESPLAYQELNVSADRGMDMVCALIPDVRRNILGGNRVWVLDEAQGLTKTAQNSILKVLEEVPDYAYFVFCTTDSHKLIPTLLNRCSRIKVRDLDEPSLIETIKYIVQAEGREIPDNVISAIAHYAGGSARKAIVKLEQCLAAQKPENMLVIIEQEEAFDATVKNLCEIFTGGKQASWRDTAKIFDALDEDPETIRRSILGWVSSALTRGWSRAIPDRLLADILRIFQFDTFNSGRPGLLLMVYDAWRLLQSGK